MSRNLGSNAQLTVPPEWPDERPGIEAEKRQPASSGHQIKADEHAQHQKLAKRKVDDLYDAEDQQPMVTPAVSVFRMVLIRT